MTEQHKYEELNYKSLKQAKKLPKRKTESCTVVNSFKYEKLLTDNYNQKEDLGKYRELYKKVN